MKPSRVVLIALAGVVGITCSLAAALLGLQPGFPLLVFDNQGAITYDPHTGLFSVDATPVAIRFSPAGGPALVEPTGGPPSEIVSLRVHVDPFGALTGGVSGDDLLVVGRIDVDGDSIPEFDGILLTGEASAFGFADSGGPTDFFDFRFLLTGGALAPQFGGGALGVFVTSDSSTFAGTFGAPFAGGAKGNMGPVPAACNETVLLDNRSQGEVCLASLRPLTTAGAGASFVLTARSLIDEAAPTNPDARGAAGSVVMSKEGGGVKTSSCSGSKCISGGGGHQDEELIFTFDHPVPAADIVVALRDIDFNADDPVIFLSRAGSARFDFAIPRAEIQKAFAGIASNAGDVTFGGFPSLPAGLLIDAFKLRETGAHVCIRSMSCANTPCFSDTDCPGRCDFCDPTTNRCRRLPGCCDDEDDDGDDDHDGQDCDTDECGSDSDCADGLFCNGAEACRKGKCKKGKRPCGGPQRCDERLKRCVECLSDDDCDDKHFCNGAESCLNGVCGVGVPPCPAAQQCHEGRDECAFCFKHKDCDDGLFCNGREKCKRGKCGSGRPPCKRGETCEEASRSCRKP